MISVLFAERILRQRLESGCFFVGGIDNQLDVSKKAGRRTIEQLHGLLHAIDTIIERPEGTETRPVYDRLNLVLAVREAALASTMHGRVVSGSGTVRAIRKSTGPGSRRCRDGSLKVQPTSTTLSSPLAS